MSRVKIDRAGPADISAITKIKKRAWLATYPSLGVGVTRDDVLKKDFIKLESGRYRNMVNKNWHYWLAKKDGQLAGYVAAKEELNRGVIKLIHVLPEFQGQGVGSALLNQALEWLRGKEIVLQVAKSNQEAISFYQKFGFSSAGQGCPIKIADKKVDTIRMEATNPRVNPPPASGVSNLVYTNT